MKVRFADSLRAMRPFESRDRADVERRDVVAPGVRGLRGFTVVARLDVVVRGAEASTDDTLGPTIVSAASSAQHALRSVLIAANRHHAPMVIWKKPRRR